MMLSHVAEHCDLDKVVMPNEIRAQMKTLHECLSIYWLLEKKCQMVRTGLPAVFNVCAPEKCLYEYPKFVTSMCCLQEYANLNT
jgi:hypothetical protein